MVLQPFDKLCLYAFPVDIENPESLDEVANLAKGIWYYRKNKYSDTIKYFNKYLILGRELHDVEIEILCRSILLLYDNNISFGETNKYRIQYIELRNNYLKDTNYSENGERNVHDIERLMIYKSDHRIGFGKYLGLTIHDIYSINPQFLIWAVINLTHFAIDFNIFINTKIGELRNYYVALEINIVKISLLREWKAEDESDWIDDQPTFDEWINEEFGDDAETAYWNLD